MSKEQLFDYHKHNLSYISDNIKFADTKAGVALGIALVMIGFFGSETKDNGLNDISIQQVGLISGLILLIIAISCLILGVLWPRYSTNTDFYLSWSGIGSFNNADEYLEKINQTNFINDMARQNYDLAYVCLKKYKRLKCGIIFLTVGAILVNFSWFFL